MSRTPPRTRAKRILRRATPPDQTAKTNAIRYGLSAIKNVGEGAMELAIKEREERGEFVSLEDFCRRLDSRVA
jgi:DNA polymerase-3 subunit alpha